MRFLIGALLTTIAAAASGAAASAPQAIPLNLSGMHPTAVLTVDGHAPITAIFDTGAQASVIEPPVGEDLHLPNNGTILVGSPGATEPLKGYLTRLPKARLGNAEFENAQAVVVALDLKEKDVGAVISPSVFSGRLVRFEFGKSQAVVEEKTAANTPTAKPYDYAGEAGHPLPSVDVQIGSVKVVAHADSGSRFGLTLPDEIAKQLSLATELTPAPPHHMAGAVHQVWTAKVKGDVRVGPLTLKDPDVEFEQGGVVANVGIQVLKQLVVVLDPAAKKDWVLLP